jgi:hypothetical protein
MTALIGYARVSKAGVLPEHGLSQDGRSALAICNFMVEILSEKSTAFYQLPQNPYDVSQLHFLKATIREAPSLDPG